MSTATKVVSDGWLRDALPRGTVLHGYELVGILGRGGFGITYKAVDRIDQVFAIKECYPKQFVVRHGGEVVPADDQDVGIVSNLRERFTREARALTRFSKSGTAGDGVVKVFTFFETNNTAYIVMEFIEGQSFEKLISTHPDGLPEPVLLPLMRDLLTALACIHDHGLLHRDIKPGNILLRREGQPVLLDFGAARGLQTTNAASSMAIFTEAYAPIEQIANETQGPFSDLYSLGVTCYQAVAGTRFPNLPSSTDRAARAARGADPLIAAVTIGTGRYSDALLGAIDRLLQIKPEDRPQNVDEFLPDVAGCFADGAATIQRVARRQTPEPSATRIATGRTSRPEPDTAASETMIGNTDATRLAPAHRPAPDNSVTMVIPMAPPPKAPGAARGKSMIPIVSGIGVLFVAAAGGAYFVLKPADTNQAPTTVVSEPAAPAAPAASPAPPPSNVSVADLPSAPGLADASKAYLRGDYTEASHAYLAAATAGDPQAQYQIGYMSQLGQGVTQDYAAAAHWYTLSATQNNRNAQLQLGSLAQNGLGIPKSYPTALHWYQLAAAQGSTPAQNQLGYLYQMGYGVPVNYAEAMRWYKQGADQGSVPALVRIGHFYAEGLGVQRDLGTAREWMTRAAAAGSAEARKWLATH